MRIRYYYFVEWSKRKEQDTKNPIYSLRSPGGGRKVWDVLNVLPRVAFAFANLPVAIVSHPFGVLKWACGGW